MTEKNSMGIQLVLFYPAIRNIIHVEIWFSKPDLTSLSTSCDNLSLSYWLSAKPDLIACDHYNLFLLVVAASRLC